MAFIEAIERLLSIDGEWVPSALSTACTCDPSCTRAR
jgi:hypothetical protein